MTVRSGQASRRAVLGALATIVAVPAAGAPASDLPPEVFLIPDTAIGDVTATGFARLLATASGLRVKPLLAMGLGGSTVPADGQLDGDAVLALLQPVADRVRRLYDAPDAMLVLLTVRDLNSAAMGTRFLFSYHNRATHLSAVSTARILAPTALGTLDTDKTLQRLFKLLLRAVGEQALHLPRSSDPKSVMYSPLLSVDDLDMIEAKLGTGI